MVYGVWCVVCGVPCAVCRVPCVVCHVSCAMCRVSTSIFSVDLCQGWNVESELPGQSGTVGCVGFLLTRAPIMHANK